jgi:hypothetical protein
VNTLILSEPGAVASLETAITRSGGQLVMRQGNALFAGVSGLDDAALSDLGARAIYHDLVSESELSALAADEQEIVTIWNSLVNRQPLDVSAFLANGADARSATYISVDEGSGGSGPTAAYEPTDTQTSTFLYGDVKVSAVC